MPAPQEPYQAVGLSQESLLTFPLNKVVFMQGGKRSVLVSEFMDKSDLRMLLGRPDLAPKFAWVSIALHSPARSQVNIPTQFQTRS